MAETLAKLAYQAVQKGKGAFGLAHKNFTSRVLGTLSPTALHQTTESLPDEVLTQLQQRFDQLLEIDWQDAEQGIYPIELLFDNPWVDFFRYYPELLLDTPVIWERAREKRYQDFSPEVKTEGYPSYYVQNFHHQTDGYLSDRSANIYDLQVEILFSGSADPMRRRILAPLKAGVSQSQDVPKILDIACGTGRTLRMIRGMLPDASLFGVDLSPAYLRKANQLLSEIPGELPQLVQCNAEELPFVENYFHGITSVFLFHELPPNVRQAIIEQCFRVLRPGGVFVICDSIQESDSPEFAVNMRNFPIMFHEPYYRHYITDDLVARLEQAGFTEVRTEVHFMSKYLIAQKSV